MVHRYTAYGLCVESEIAFHSLLPCESTETDVVIRFGRVNVLKDSSEHIATGDNFCITADGTFIWDGSVGTVLVRRGREMIIEAQNPADEATLSGFVLDKLATLLHQRGLFVLHASALTFEGGAVAFMGDSGVGKSTLALSLYNRGYFVISDDLTAFDLSVDPPMVLPALPEINTWPETLEALSYDQDQFRRVQPSTEKRTFPMTDRFIHHSLPLRGLYVLDRGNTTRIEQISPGDATLALIRSSYRAELPEGSFAANHLSQCARLAQTIPVRRVMIHRGPRSIETVARLVEADVCATTLRAIY